MKISNHFSLLTAFLMLFLSALMTNLQAQVPVENFSLNFEEINLWDIARVPNKVADGQLVLATYKKDGTQLIAQVRGGKIVEIGEQSRGFKYVPLVQRSITCPVPRCKAYGYVYCYVVKKQCFCICMGDLTIGG